MDDAFVLVEEEGDNGVSEEREMDEVDGGPLCREKTIESWKRKKIMMRERRRRGSCHGFGDV